MSRASPANLPKNKQAFFDSQNCWFTQNAPNAPASAAVSHGSTSGPATMSRRSPPQTPHRGHRAAAQVRDEQS